MKKSLLYICIVLIISQLTSCNTVESAGPLPEPTPTITNLVFSTTSIERTSVSIKYTGTLNGSTKKIYYKALDLNDEYKSLFFNTNPIIISNLLSGTAYEFRIEVSNSTSKLQTDPYYVTTHSVDFNYNDFFYKDLVYKYGYFSDGMAYSAINYEHIITADGLENYSKADVYLVNKDKTDSIIIPSVVVDKTLKFTIPNDFISQDPRESYKEVYVGVKIKDDYQYIAGSGINTSSREDDKPLIFYINNTQPHLNSIEFYRDNINIGSCPPSTGFLLKGEFYGTRSIIDYNWTPAESYFIVFKEDGSLYRSISDQNFDSDKCSILDIDSKPTTALTIHTAKTAYIAMPFPPGKYKGKMLFNFKNPDRISETNLVEFEVK